MRRVRLVLAAFAATVAGPLACEDLEVRAFIASRWNPDQECLERSGAVDVFDAADARSCDRTTRCWLSPAGDLYATTECVGPADWERTTEAEDERCDDAIDAFAAGSEGRCEE
jgi:hypothetical protein